MNFELYGNKECKKSFYFCPGLYYSCSYNVTILVLTVLLGKAQMKVS